MGNNWVDETIKKINKAILYFEDCFMDIKENPTCYQENAFECTNMALIALRGYRNSLNEINSELEDR